ncbi:MAG: hypothetical protein CVU63_04670 [Deltaproteobacteria bacterium HGW-Deltaproteobacteria-20]|nr:MAG: hypothetical protein CVU63_04670 [Deltaproteobacteria bacterium HGW-Deltaproteobacteria-20]
MSPGPGAPGPGAPGYGQQPGGYGPPPGGYAPPPGQVPPGGPPPAGAPGSESAVKNAKIARGCGAGGCGCAVVLLIAGIILFAFGSQRATQEAMPFAIVVLGLTPFATILGAALLGWGMMSLKKLTGK